MMHITTTTTTTGMIINDAAPAAAPAMVVELTEPLGVLDAEGVSWLEADEAGNRVSIHQGSVLNDVEEFRVGSVDWTEEVVPVESEV